LTASPIILLITVSSTYACVIVVNYALLWPKKLHVVALTKTKNKEETYITYVYASSEDRAISVSLYFKDHFRQSTNYKQLCNTCQLTLIRVLVDWWVKVKFATVSNMNLEGNLLIECLSGSNQIKC